MAGMDALLPDACRYGRVRNVYRRGEDERRRSSLLGPDIRTCCSNPVAGNAVARCPVFLLFMNGGDVLVVINILRRVCHNTDDDAEEDCGKVYVQPPDWDASGDNFHRRTPHVNGSRARGLPAPACQFPTASYLCSGEPVRPDQEYASELNPSPLWCRVRPSTYVLVETMEHGRVGTPTDMCASVCSGLQVVSKSRRTDEVARAREFYEVHYVGTIPDAKPTHEAPNPKHMLHTSS